MAENQNDAIQDIDENQGLDTYSNLSLNKPLSYISSSGIWGPELLDGVYSEKISGITQLGDMIPLELNNSVLTSGLSVNVFDINETREFSRNGNFSSSTQGWSLKTHGTDPNDVNLNWNSSFLGSNGVANINLTGLENEHHFTRFVPNNERDDLSTVGDWEFDAPADPDYDAKYDALVGNLVGINTGVLELSWNWNPVMTLPFSGIRTGYAFTNFTYNGTSNVKDAILSFSYEIDFGGSWGLYNYGHANLSVYIVDPYGIEYQIGNWKGSFTPSTSGYSGTGIVFKSFNLNDLGHILKDQGNYTLKFRADHSHQKVSGDLIMGSCIKIDGIRFAVNYTKKEFPTDSEVSIEQIEYFNRIPRNWSQLKAKFLMTTPHIQLNDSDSTIVVKFNSNVVYSKLIRNTNPNEWYTIDKFINNTVLSGENINITIGVDLKSVDPIVFNPNETFSLFLDNISFYAKATPMPNQVELFSSLPNSNINKTVSPTDFGKGSAIFDNGSLIMIGDTEPYPSAPYLKLESYQLYFFGNSSNTSISYEIEKFGFTWRDTIIRELNFIRTDLNTMLENIRDSLCSKYFPISLLLEPNFISLVNLSRINNFEDAERYSSLLGKQFPIMFKGLLNSLTGDFYKNRYNLDHDIDYFTSINPIQIATMGSKTSLYQIFEEIYKSYDWGVYKEALIDRLTGLYNQYTVILDSKMTDLKNRLKFIEFNPSQLQYLNLSSIYRNLREIFGSLDLVKNGLDTHVNIDPMNSIKNWVNPAQINPVILDNSFNGIYLGNMLTYSEVISKLYNITTLESWKYSTFFEYIQSDSSDIDFGEDYISIVNPLGLFGYIPCEDISDTPFSLPYDDEGFSSELNDNYYSHTFSIGSVTDVMNYLMLMIFIEDSMSRPNYPLVLEYAYQSTKAIFDKTISSEEDLDEYNTLKQDISLNITVSDTIISNDSGFTDIQIRNIGNASSISLIQKYYMITNNGLKLIMKQNVILSDNLEQSHSINRRIPIQSLDIMLMKNTFGTIYGINNISNQYIICHEFFVGNRIAEEYWSSIFYSPFFTKFNSSITNPINIITASNIYDSMKISLNPEKSTEIYNVSDVLDDYGIEYSQIHDNFIMMISRVDIGINGLGEISYNCKIGSSTVGYDNINRIDINQFNSIHRLRLGNKGIDVICFTVKDVLIESGIIEVDAEPTKNQFDTYFTFNLSTLTNNFDVDVQMMLFSNKIITFLPLWFEKINLKYTLSDYDNKVQFQLPFLELSGNSYYRIVSCSVTLDDNFYPYYYVYFNQLKQIQGTYYNSYITLYAKPSDPDQIQAAQMRTVLKFYNNIEISITTEITLEYYGIYRFKPELSPNLAFVLVFGLIFVITNITVIRFFKRYAIGVKPKRKRMDFTYSV